MTFTNYVAGQGGEQFTLAEFGLTGTLQSVEFIQFVNALTGLECNAKYCIYKGGGKVMLMNPATPDVEMPSGPLNWIIGVFITAQ